MIAESDVEQGNKTDSLKLLLEEPHSVGDKIELLKQLYDVSAPQNELYALRLIELAQNQGDDKEEALSYILLGKTRYVQEKYEQALESYLKALEIIEREDLKEIFSRIHAHIGITYFLLNDYSKAIIHLKGSVEYENKKSIENRKISCFNTLGNVYVKIGDYPSALQYYLEALKILEIANNDFAVMSRVINNIGIIYTELKNPDKAIEFYNRALAISGQTKDKQLKSTLLSNLGICYLDKSDFNKAENYFYKGLEVIGSESNAAKAYILNNLGTIYLHHDKFDLAMSHFRESLLINKTISDVSGIVNAYGNIAKVHREKSDYKPALEYFNKGLALAQQYTLKTPIPWIYKDISETYKLLNRPKEALKYYELYEQQKDSLFNKEKATIMSNMEVKYEVEKTEKENIELKNKNKIETYKNAVLIGCLIMLLIVSGFILSRQLAKMKNNKLLYKKNRQLDKTQKALIETDLKNTKLQLEYKKGELTNLALFITKRNDFLNNLKLEMAKASRKLETEKDKSLVKQLQIQVAQSLDLSKERKQFYIYVEQVHQEFFLKLHHLFPGLTTKERQLAAYIRLSLSSKEIASLLNIEPMSVNVNRHKLRKKLGLNKNDDLPEFIAQI